MLFLYGPIPCLPCIIAQGLQFAIGVMSGAARQLPYAREPRFYLDSKMCKVKR